MGFMDWLPRFPNGDETANPEYTRKASRRASAPGGKCQRRGASSGGCRPPARLCLAEAVLVRGELALAHLAAVGLDRADHVAAQVGVLLDEPRPEVVEQAQ